MCSLARIRAMLACCSPALHAACAHMKCTNYLHFSFRSWFRDNIYALNACLHTTGVSEAAFLPVNDDDDIEKSTQHGFDFRFMQFGTARKRNSFLRRAQYFRGKFQMKSRERSVPESCLHQVSVHRPGKAVRGKRCEAQSTYERRKKKLKFNILVYQRPLIHLSRLTCLYTGYRFIRTQQLVLPYLMEACSHRHSHNSFVYLRES